MKPTTAKQGKDVKPLSIKQQRFCEFVVAGDADTVAYEKAGYVGGRNAERNACRLREYEGVKAYIAALRAPQTKQAQRKKDDNIRFLAEAITATLSDIGPDSPFCVEYTEEVVAGGSRGKLKRGQAPSGNETTGPTVLRRKVKKLDPLRAIDLFSRLLGHYEPDRVEVDVGEKTLLSIKERAAQVTSALAGKYAEGKKK